MQESTSFWSDIKELGEQLAKTPDSLCFARLSDVYLKVGLLDDALQVARQGVAKHPRYLSGQRALALACHAKGFDDDAVEALQQVTEAMPEDITSQKLLGRLYMGSGNMKSARQAFLTALEFAPDDIECRIELESLERSAPMHGNSIEADDDDIIEDLEILEEIEILEEDQPEVGYGFEYVPPEPVPVAGLHHDPLSTSTLAELYVSQGFTHKALDIYRAILADNPEDRGTAERIIEIELLDSGSLEAGGELDDTVIGESEESEEAEESEKSEEEFVSTVPDVVTFPEAQPESAPLFEVTSEFESQQSSANAFLQQESVRLVPQQGIADNALATLSGWLENIRRIKSCR